MNILLFGLMGFLGWMFLFSQIKGKSKCRNRWIRGGGDEPEQPAPPSYQLPDWAQGLPPELLQYIRQGVGQQLTIPQEYTQAGDVYRNLLNYMPELQYLTEPAEYGQLGTGLDRLLNITPEQFQYPMEDIQKALAAQQALQLEEYQKQVNPILARQGQYDSTYAANLLSDYMKGQQAQTYGTTADLLTNQATQNYNLQQWLPQFQSGILGQIGNLGTARLGVQESNANLQNALAQWLPQFQSGIAGNLQGLGTAQSGIQQYNMQYPYQTYIPALGSLFQTGQQQADAEYQAAMNQYQAAMDEYNRNQKGGLFGGLLGGGGGALGGLGAAALLGLGGPMTALAVGGGALLGGLSGGLGPEGTGGSLFSTGLSAGLGSMGGFSSPSPSYAQTGYGNVLTAPANYYQTGGNIRNIRGIPWS